MMEELEPEGVIAVQRNLKAKNIDEIAPNHQGWLRKWANYVKGYARRYFVINGPNLEYYMRKDDFNFRQPAGRLDIKKCFIRIVGDLNFIIIENDKKWFIKTSSPEERSKWIVNIQNLKVLLNETESTSASEREKCMFLISQLESKLKDLIYLNKELQINGDYLLSIFSTFSENNSKDLRNNFPHADSKIFFESICNYRSQTSNFKNYISQMITLILDAHKSMQTVIASEIKERQNLEAIIDAIAEKFDSSTLKTIASLRNSLDDVNIGDSSKLNSNLNNQQSTNLINSNKLSTSDNDLNKNDSRLSDASSDSFYDPLSQNINEIAKKNSPKESLIDFQNCDDNHDKNSDEKENEGIKNEIDFTINDKDCDYVDMSEHKSPLLLSRRTSVHPRKGFSLVQILFSAIKKSANTGDLARISMPVCICEPLSHLQRMSECMENSFLLDKAANAKIPGEELVFIATFLGASYSSSAFRLNKPFNPLLHETYEWDRMHDLGWKLISEQVSHHPPVSALHAESDNWELSEDVTLKSNYNPLWITIRPEGNCLIKLKTNGHLISLKKPETKINGLSYSSPWIENSGSVTIFNHSTGYYCKVELKKSARWAKYTREINGIVFDSENNPIYSIRGIWNKEIAYGCIDKNKMCQKYVTIWREETVFDEYRKSMYNMPTFALQMNELEQGISPTDTRNRKDIQCLEQGNHQNADNFKSLYEESQRQRRYKRLNLIEQGIDVDEIKPHYFEQKFSPIVNQNMYVTKNNYWNSKESSDWKCPIDIFDVSQ